MAKLSLRGRLLGGGAALVASTLALAVLVSVPSSETRSNTPSQSQPAAIPVSVAVVEQRDVTLWDEFSGRLDAVERVEARPRVAGAIKALHFREGALVKEGDLLITIDPDPYAAEVERTKAQVLAAEARLDYAQVRAPVAGRVGKLEVTVGNLVAAGPSAPMLTTLVSVDPIYASFNADEEVVMRALKSLGAQSYSQVERIPVR